MRVLKAIFLLVLALPAALALPPLPASAQSSSSPVFTLKDRGYDITTLRGMNSAVDFYLPGPGAVQLAAPGRLKLHFSYSNILRGDKSSFTVRLNGHDTASYRLQDNAGAEQWLDVPLAADLIKPDFNDLQLAFYMRQDVDNNVCSDADNPLLWATILPDSSIAYGSGPALASDEPLDLANYPAPFYSSSLGPNPPLRLMMPAQPSATTLTSAASMVAWLGQVAGARALEPSVDTSGTLLGSATVAIGAGKDFGWLKDQPLPLKYDSGKGQFLDANGAPIAPETGVLQVFEWQRNGKAVAPVLLVSGGSDEGVRRAALALASRSYVGLLHGKFALITAAPDVDNLSKGSITPGTYTFGDLAASGNDPTVQGRGRQSVALTFFVPQSFSFATAPEVTVHFSHAAGLDNRSLLIVEINGTAVASTRLDDNNTTDARLTAKVPVSTLRPGANSLVAIFDMRPQDDRPCDRDFSSVAWGTIHHDSDLNLPFDNGPTTFSLGSLGAPFIQAGAIRDTTLVVPPQPDALVLSQTLTLAARLGQQTRSDMTYLPVSTETNPAALPPTHLIVLGTPAGQPLVNGLANAFPLRFNANDQLEWRGASVSETPDAPVLLAVQNQTPIGVLQLGRSPDDKNLAVLLVSGASEGSLRWAIDALAKGGLTGNVALATAEGDVSTLSYRMPVPVTAAEIQQQSPLLVAGLAAGLALVLFGVTAFLTMTRRRRTAQEVA